MSNIDYYGPYKKWELGLKYLSLLYNAGMVDPKTRQKIYAALTSIPANGKKEQEGFAKLDEIRPGGFIAWLTKRRLRGEE